MVTRGIHRGECGLVKGPLDAATVGGALAKGIQLFFIHWLVIDIYPCCCEGSMGRGEPAVVMQWLEDDINLGTSDAAAVA